VILGCDLWVLLCDAGGGRLGRVADTAPVHREERQACVACVAGDQWGNITYPQLRACGLSPSAIGRWSATGRIHRVLPRVYAVGHRSPAPEAFWAAALLYCGDESVLTRYTGLAAHGLNQPPNTVTVAVPKPSRKQRGVEPHSSMPFERGEVVIRRGLRTTSIERTLLDLAAIGEPVERLVADAVAKQLTSIAKLQRYVERRAGARGAARLCRCIEGRQTRSRTEEEFARWLEGQDIDPPDFNVVLGPYTLDAAWPAARLVVEIDTYETHGTRHSFEADRQRDAYLASHGYRTIRVTPRRWRSDGVRLASDLRRALAYP
jgi:very-short-patch-repair endonuclease